MRVPVSRPLLAIQIVALATAACLSLAQAAPGESSIFGRPMLVGLLWLVLAWGAAFGTLLWIYLATSLDHFSDLRREAMRASVHGLWLVPGSWLILPASPPGSLIGMLIVVNAARLLASHPPPRRVLFRDAPRDRGLFAETSIPSGFFSREASSALFAGFAIEAGACIAAAGFPRTAAILLAGGTAAWTWSSVARGAMRPHRQRHPVHTVLNVATVLLMTVALSVARRAEPAETGGPVAVGWRGTTRQTLRNLVRSSRSSGAFAAHTFRATALAAPPVQPVPVGSGGIPGLVLQPHKRRPQSLVLSPGYRSPLALSRSRPLSIAFTGEYHLFRISSAGLPPGSVTQAGSPLDAVYVTTNGSDMETDAWQEFDPPLETALCSRIQLTLMNGETFPASATMILLATGANAQIGPEIFGLNGTSEETLDFAVPPSFVSPLRAIRVVFRHDPSESSHSAKVAIRTLTFLPKAL
jgi:hypothetical protein